MKLLLYEMKKSWLKLPIIILLILFWGLNFYKLSDTYRIYGRFSNGSSEYMKAAYYKIYNDILSGEITDEKINYVKEKRAEFYGEIKDGNFSTEYDETRLTKYVYGDFALFDTVFVPEIEYAVTYPNLTADIVEKAYDNIGFFAEHNNADESAKNRYIYDIYKDRQIKNYNVTEWVRLYFEYDFSSLLVMIMLICGLANSFSSEKESGMFKLISANGQIGKMVKMKLISSAAYVCLLTSFFTAADLIIVNHFSKIDGLLNPVYSAQIFSYSPFDHSLLTAIVICCAAKLLSYIIIAEIIMIISAAVKNSIAAVGSSFAVCAGLIVAANRSATFFNPVNLLTGYKLLSEFDCIIFFGKPILTLYAVLIVYAIAAVILSAIIRLIFDFRGSEKCVKIRTEKAAV